MATLDRLQSDLIDWLDGEKLFDVHNCTCMHMPATKIKNKIKNKPDRPTLVRMSEVTRNNELILGGLLLTFRLLSNTAVNKTMLRSTKEYTE